MALSLADVLSSLYQLSYPSIKKRRGRLTSFIDISSGKEGGQAKYSRE